MHHFPKIDTLFNRGDDFKVDVSGDYNYRRPEFAAVDNWIWMEKLDGSNISIVSDNINGTHWRGRTDKSQFVPEVQNHLNLLIEKWHKTLQLKLHLHCLDSIEIFGEVYGPKIQSGGIYATDLRTKFYDIRVNNSVWLDWATVIDYALELEFVVPMWGTATTKQLVDFVQEGFDTYERGGSGGSAEGVVAKTEVPLYNNNNDRLIWKLKTRDFA